MKQNPLTYTNFLFKITLEWVTPLVFLGIKKPLTMEDVWDLHPSDKTKTMFPRFEKRWKKSPNLLKVLNLVFGLEFWAVVLLRFVVDAAYLVRPFFLRFILQAISPSANKPEYEGYLWTVGLFLIQIIYVITYNQYYYILMRLSIRVRSVLSTAVYQKTLRLSTMARLKRTTGEILNLMQLDTNRVGEAVTYFHQVWAALVQAIVCSGLLIGIMGWPALTGIGILLFLIPLQVVSSKLFAKWRTSVQKHTDQRIKLTNEVLQGARIIKLFGWEFAFRDSIQKVRLSEVFGFVKLALLKATINTLMMGAPIIASVVSFLVYAAVGNALKADVVYPALSYFALLRFPLTFMPVNFFVVLDGNVSMKRLQSFLQEEEISNDYIKPVTKSTAEQGEPTEESNLLQTEQAPPETPVSEPTTPTQEVAIRIKHATFEWETPEPSKQKKPKGLRKLTKKQKLPPPTPSALFSLKNMNLEIPKGSLCFIVGAVATGKSSFLNALLANMKQKEGTIEMDDSLAFCPQQAWIKNDTLQQNILFGQEYEESKYKKVIEACALTRDLEILTAGDQTEIGEKGINLSGGQRQRVSLARAVYSNKNIYLLDDVLSAVDAHVGKHIFHECILKMLGDKTRLFVTHQIQFIKYASHVIYLQDGLVQEFGTLDQVMSLPNGHVRQMSEKFSETKHQVKEQSVEEMEEMNHEIHTEEVSVVVKGESDPTEAAVMSAAIMSSMMGSMMNDWSIARNYMPKKSKAPKHQIIQQEERLKGAISVSIYWKYLMMIGGPLALLLLFLLFVITQAGLVSADWWISNWNNTTLSKLTFGQKLGTYAGLGVAGVLLVFLRDVMVIGFGLLGSIRLHNQTLTRILRAPMAFFDTTPIGRIIARFSKELENADTKLMTDATLLFGCIFQILAVVAIVAYASLYFLIAIVPIMILYFIVQELYRKSSRELKRLESITRSPIYAFCTESLTGLPTIRAYKLETMFCEQIQARVDYQARAAFATLSGQRWMAIRLEIVGSLIVLVAALFAVIFRKTTFVDIAGLSLTYALQVTSFFTQAIKYLTEFEMSMSSIERLVQYAAFTEMEAPVVIKKNRVPASWPSNGEIQIVNYSVSYRPGLPKVLNNLNIHIKAGENIGVVGRTGCGKSTLMLCLFRILQNPEGSISIDDIDIGTIGLHDLRQRIGIIPQEPLLFSGSVRFNIDPFNEHSDAEVWTVLEQSYLKTFVEGLPLQLSTQVSGDSDVFSVGQRQLMCLARALIKKSKILIMDEATASVDFDTDLLIQKAVKKYFANCTRLTIAHRLNTIIDSDRIVVMDAGSIKELGTPYELISNPESAFLSMINETGTENAEKLKQLIHEDNEAKKNALLATPAN